MISAPAIVCGAAVGAGLVIAARGLLPGRPDLGDVLARMDATRLENLEPTRTPVRPTSALERLGGTVLTALGESTLHLPRQELELIGRSPARHVGMKIGLALYGLLLPALTGYVAVLLGASLPFVFPAVGALGLAAGFWFLPDVQIKQQATEARGEFRHAIEAYLELVGLERAADAGPIEALKRAAAVGEGWVFTRVRDAITRAELAGVTPWDGLKQLSEELGVPELGAPADIIALAGEEGAAVHHTLRAQAKSLRGALLTAAKTEANKASEKMVMPVTVLVMIMTVYVGYPALTRIMAS